MFPDGQRNGGVENDLRSWRQTHNPRAASTGHGKAHILKCSLPSHSLDQSQWSVFLSCTQAYQDDDPRKYSVATVLVRVLAVNQFYPEFDTAEYQGFVTAGKTTASLVNTYGSKALVLKVQDRDFKHVRIALDHAHITYTLKVQYFITLFYYLFKQGFNPMIHFTFSPTSNHTEIYQITQEGLLIARTNQLRPKQIHFLEVSLSQNPV